MRLTVLADNTPKEGWLCEHGLALMLETSSGRLLFDTGAGFAVGHNLEKAGFSFCDISRIVLSHGHYDHTGGLAQILEKAPRAHLFYGEGISKERYSLHPGKPVKTLTMPAASAAAAAALPACQRREIKEFTALDQAFFLTGAVPRNSFEDCGGPFFLEKEGRTPDLITDEISLLSASGVLIQGCTHGGIINTVEHCRKHRPGLRIRVIAGGLHLLHASPERLEKTAAYLNALGLEKLILLHCTGAGAADFLKEQLTCEVICGCTGACYDL